MKKLIMANIKLTIEYHGLPYCGWQFQKNEKTIQGEIEKAIFKFSGEKKNSTRCWADRCRSSCYWTMC